MCINVASKLAKIEEIDHMYTYKQFLISIHDLAMQKPSHSIVWLLACTTRVKQQKLQSSLPLKGKHFGNAFSMYMTGLDFL